MIRMEWWGWIGIAYLFWLAVSFGCYCILSHLLPSPPFDDGINEKVAAILGLVITVIVSAIRW